MNGCAPLSQNEGSKSQSSDGICPTDSPHSIDKQSRKSDPGHVGAQGRLSRIRLQRTTRSHGCQLPFPVDEQSHGNCGANKDSVSNKIRLPLPLSKKVQPGW